MIFSKTAQVGGVAEAVSANWDEEQEVRYQTAKAKMSIMKDLEVAGYLKVVPLARTGNYRKHAVILDLPGLRKLKR